MLQSTQIYQFAQVLFDSDDVARQATPILKAILDAQSARQSDIAQKMRGNPDATYKHLQRFMQKVDAKQTLVRLFQADAPFVLGDVTELPRPQAYRTSYVGTLKDGKTRGYWLLLLATPYRGRAIPCHFVTYSSRTIAQQANSRNLNHLQAFQYIKDLLGDKPLVLDREFSYRELLENLVAARINFVIRLNLGSHPPHFFDEHKQRVELQIEPGETKVYRRLFYKGKGRVNRMGYGQQGYAEPLWVMTNLRAEVGGQIYFARMKIDESFRDLKNLLHLEKVMNKQQAKMEQVIAWALLAFTVGFMVGEELRDVIYGPAPSTPTTNSRATSNKPIHQKPGQKWKLYSGLFILLKQKVVLGCAAMQDLVRRVRDRFKLSELMSEVQIFAKIPQPCYKVVIQPRTFFLNSRRPRLFFVDGEIKT